MKGQTRTVAVMVSALLGLLLLATAASAQSAADVQRADERFALGIQAFEDGKYPEALAQMAEAFELAPNYRSAAGLGQVELHLSHFRDAAEHLDFSLRHFPLEGETDGRARVMAGLAEARSHVFALAIRCEVSGAEVSIDDKIIGRTPITHDLYLEPGEPVIRVRAPGFAPFTAQVYAPAGAQKELSVALRREGNVALSHQSAAANGDHAWWVLGVGGGLALAAAGTGLGFWLDARSKDDQASSLAHRLVEEKARCDSRAAADCAAVLELRDDAEGQADKAALLWTSASALTLATATLFTWLELGRASTGPMPDAAVLPALTPSAVGLNVRGSF